MADKIINIIDELNTARAFVRAAYNAAHGLAIESEDREAMACVLGNAEDALESVKTKLEEVNSAENNPT